MFTSLATVRSEAGIEIVDPNVLKKAISDHDANRQRSLYIALLAQANNAIANRVNELNKDRGSREIGAVIRVPIERMHSEEAVAEVKRQLEAIGYTIKVCHDDGDSDGPGRYTAPSDWFEVYV